MLWRLLVVVADGVVGVVRFDSNLHFNALRFAWLGGTRASRFIMEIPSSRRHPSCSGTHGLFGGLEAQKRIGDFVGNGCISVKEIPGCPGSGWWWGPMMLDVWMLV